MEIILASQSPRRRELMGLFPFPITVRAAQIPETMDASLPPAQAVAQISREKALAVSRTPEDIVIAADTIVVCDGQILGKPTDRHHALQMLRLLSGREHQVMTGLTVLRGERETVCTQITRVRFRPLDEAEIRRYIATGEPMDKAGSYGIQGGGALFVRELEGDYYNVMGLPVCRLCEILKEMAPDIMEEMQ